MYATQEYNLHWTVHIKKNAYFSHLHFPALQVEREKMRHEEAVMRATSEKGALDQSLTSLDQENIELQRQTQALQATLAETEQQHAQRLEYRAYSSNLIDKT